MIANHINRSKKEEMERHTCRGSPAVSMYQTDHSRGSKALVAQIVIVWKQYATCRSAVNYKRCQILALCRYEQYAIAFWCR
jgi:hypothetical protein